jgi:hypothetical protein
MSSFDTDNMYTNVSESEVIEYKIWLITQE